MSRAPVSVRSRRVEAITRVTTSSRAAADTVVIPELQTRRNRRRWLLGCALTTVTAPVIYSIVIPLVLLDLWVTLFQLLTFPIYGIPWVRRRPYFAIDRAKLPYLNPLERVNCTYCSYANGLLAYVREVASRTELYWCPIRHARSVADPHRRYNDFTGYGDARAYRRELSRLRRTLLADRSR